MTLETGKGPQTGEPVFSRQRGAANSALRARLSGPAGTLEQVDASDQQPSSCGPYCVGGPCRRLPRCVAMPDHGVS